jgi:predicted nucleotide-binding protein (sugar kinase/HSP70/actin superfamily)
MSKKKFISMKSQFMNQQNRNNSLSDRTLYIPRMSMDGSSALAAVYRSVGVNAQLVPESDSHSIELARQFTIGEECYPEVVTLGSFLKIIEEPDFDASKTAFIMPTTGGPCRFGQYKPLLEKILIEKGHGEVLVVSPSSVDGYAGLNENASNLFRLGWWAVVCSDALRKMLLQTRPYEKNQGDSDRVHEQGINSICHVLESCDIDMKQKMGMLVDVMRQLANNFSDITADYTKSKPLVGIVGEIYCRMDDYANANLIRRIEKYGGEAWLAPIAEWIWYTDFYHTQQLKIKGAQFSTAMLSTIVKNMVQLKDEHKLLKPLQQRFTGYEESESIKHILDLAKSYLPHWGVVGEMLLNIGGAIYFYEKGVDGIIDISPFTCMNGIVCEAIYPKVSTDHNNIPIKNFYFDETESDYDRDIEIFLELAATYQKRKKITRTYPSHFC